MKNRYVDVHQHLMYGVDDGPKVWEETRAMLEAAAANGIRKIVATPHITPGVVKFNMNQYLRSVEKAQSYCRKKGLDIRIYKGCEILYTDQTCRLLREGAVPTMAGTDRVLVEFSPDERFSRIYEAVEQLNMAGYIPIIAHVERYRCLVMKPSLTEKLSGELEVLFQMNCSSVLEKRGFWERHFIKRMLKKEMISALGTDAHNTTTRPVRMKEAFHTIAKHYGHAYALRLTNGWVFKD